MQQSCRVFGSIGSLAIGSLVALSPVQAQVIPDTTLGVENSIVTPDQMIRGLLSDRIDGGALRGSNLFHSFLQFNVLEGRVAYFSNPTGVQNILGRVTGGDPSAILGRLGVLGDANLFLLNPNGFVFGANSSLDIAGSLTVSTADAIQLGQGGLFSATAPQQSTLLAVDPGALLFNAIANQSTIQSQGNLSAGQSLTFAAGNLDLTGQVRAGQDVTLQAMDTLRIRDSVTTPFVAQAGGTLLLQGNAIDIFALNNLNSGLSSGGDLVLRSANPVIGDAHYRSGGNFRIEQLTGGVGSLFSVQDPVILAVGDVSFGDYTGASLHILAGGSVTLGNVLITGTGTATDTINPNNPDPLLAALSNVTLSNGTTQVVAGDVTPTLDVRAGIDWNQVPGGLPGNQDPSGLGPTFGVGATSANITIGNILFDVPESLVLITNQYLPNTALTGGSDITLNEVFADNFLALPATNGSNVIVDARGSLALNGQIDTSNIDISTGSPIGNGGNITFLASGDLTLAPGIPLRSSGLLGGNITLQSSGNLSLGAGSSISVESSSQSAGTIAGTIRLTGRSISGFNTTIRNATPIGVRNVEASSGDIILEAVDRIDLNQGSLRTSLEVESTTSGNGGNIRLQATDIVVTGGYELNAGTNNRGAGGNVLLDAENSITIDGNSFITSLVFVNATGAGGNIQINAPLLSMSGIFSSLQTATIGQGDAGDIIIEANRVDLSDGALISSQANAAGAGGDINIRQASTLSLLSGATISAETSGQGAAGNVSVTANSVRLSGPASQISSQTSATTTTGVGGAIVINANDFLIENQAGIDASTSGAAAGGSIDVTTGTFTAASGGQLSTSTSADGAAGTITVTANTSTNLSGGGTGLFASTSGAGSGGNIGVTTGVFTIADRAVLDASTSNGGQSGGILVNANSFSGSSGGQLRTSTSGSGAAGAIAVTANTSTTLAGSGTGLFASTSGSGAGGNIGVTTATFQIADRAVLDASTTGDGQGGSVVVNADTFSAIGGGQLRTSTSGGGNAGNITLDVDDTTALSGAGTGLFASTSGSGNGGDILVDTDTFQISEAAVIDASTTGSGKSGTVTINAENYSGTTGGRVLTNTSRDGDAGNIVLNVVDTLALDGQDTGIFASSGAGSTGDSGSIVIDPRQVILSNGASIGVTSLGSGNGGNVQLQAGTLTLNSGGSISAATASGEGGNITLDIADILFMRQNTLISAAAGGSGNGGNIAINASFIITFPTDDSNISANAVRGRGGNINITTQALFGFSTLGINTPLSDITASSEFGVNGVVQVNSPDVEVQSAITELAGNFPNPDQVAAGSCLARRAVGSGSFIVTGSGGLARTPYDGIVGGYYSTTTVEPLAGEGAGVGRSNQPSDAAPAPTTWRTGEPIQEAQGIIKTADGRTQLGVVPREMALASSGDLICQ